jgi:predicted ATPase
MPLIGPVSAPVIIGRDQELAVIQAFLRREGDARTLLVSGEAGIGKSRLVREAAASAEALGFRVLTGACFDRDQTLPFAPFFDIVRTCAATRLENPQSRLMAIAPMVSRLMPEMAASAAHPDTFEPEQNTRRRFHEMEELLGDVATEQPLLVVMEDLHWSDETSLQLLLRLSRRATAAPFLLLLTYRGDETGSILSRFLAELDRARTATELALRPLSPSGVEQQVRAILDLPRPAGAVFVRSLHGLTGGNPFFVEEVLRSLIAAGDVYPSDAGWQRRSLDQLRVPRSVDDAVGRRAALLGGAAREALTLAAVAGRSVDFGLLQTLSGFDDEVLIAAIKELIAAQLLIDVSEDRFAFRHALTRQAIYTGIFARERRALHARVARAIERSAGTNPQAALADLAYHHYEAGAWERASVLARAAGDRASALCAPQAAAEHYTRPRCRRAPGYSSRGRSLLRSWPCLRRNRRLRSRPRRL